MKKERVIAKLKRWCMRRDGEGIPAGEIYTTAQIPRSTFYDWLNRYRQHGLEGLQPKSRRPHTTHRTPEEILNEIKTLRVRTGWGRQKIAGYLRTRRFGSNPGGPATLAVLR
jgi:transposase